MADPAYMLNQLELFERGNGWEQHLSEPLWNHRDMQIVRSNDMLREKYKEALASIVAVDTNQRQRDAMNRRQRIFQRAKFEALVEQCSQLMIERAEKVKAYELLRRLVAFDNKSIELKLF